MGLKIDEIIYNITSDDFIDDEVLFDAPWLEAIDIEYNGGDPRDGNYFKEPKRPIYI